jgi:hypothetical protein
MNGWNNFENYLRSEKWLWWDEIHDGPYDPVFILDYME